eukprot:scaffold242_cov73-Cyclotella_meneghiniana.AAC.1
MDGVFEGSWLGLREELGDTDGKDVLGDNDGSDEREGLSDGITLGVSEGLITGKSDIVGP